MSHTQVAAGLAELGLPGGALVGGQWQQDGLHVPVTDPEDGRLIAFVARSSAEDVARAVTGVARSVVSDAWPLWERRRVIEVAARMVIEHGSRLAGIIRAESSKTIAEAEVEVRRCAETLQMCAAASDLLRGDMLEFDNSFRGAGKLGWYVRAPVGVIAAITPFNDPLNLVAHKIGPALIGGNGVVIKPAETTPLSALALADILIAAGVPPRRLAIVCGGAEVGSALVAHQDVDLISFTGGRRVAEQITSAVGPKKILMELGGNNPTLVCADADLDLAATEIVRGAFGVAGQNCLSVQRVYVHDSLFSAVRDRVVELTAALTVGPKANRDTDIGPMITEDAARRVHSVVAEAVRHGATVHVGGRRDGSYYFPTVLTEVPADARALTEEIFGPIVVLLPFQDIRAAIASANGTASALQAGVFTSALEDAFAIADQLVAGAVVINGTSDLRIDSMPFGGFKGTGIGREGVRFAIEAMTEPKSTIVQRIQDGTTFSGQQSKILDCQP
jgi:acyl-CoA reductase-like NAD-dependent aldehyde dehydrogenase